MLACLAAFFPSGALLFHLLLELAGNPFHIAILLINSACGI